ncbi:class I adenylate cyclase [Pasteurellaceae bacterium LIM206]|nr:class I adenylate cyclase [Pasteurellaceae bacterium LIM206]
MKYDLEFTKKQVETLRQIRIRKALDGSSAEFRHVFQLLTLLLHLNHPTLPGYVEHAPAGISAFKLSVYQQDFLAKQFPNINFRQLEDFSFKQTEERQIYGIYVMGSIATIMQTAQSDLDTWVCYNPSLPAESVAKLQQKARLLQDWAKRQQIEINLFLMEENRFECNQYADDLTGENCGSAQYMLLLDEFYRSAIRLAGKPLLWMHIWTEREKDYEREVDRLVADGRIRREDWVDFGGLGAFSANEYFGASLWQLYKGIDSPYKSVIKIVLLEAYSRDYPNTRLISREFKRKLFETGPTEEYFDAYLVMLQRVTDYLNCRKDGRRLDFVRCCFYIKATESVHIQPLAAWRADILHKLTREWQWSEADIEYLNQRRRWKIHQVKTMYARLLRVLMLSYRSLVNFGRKYDVNASIMPQDLSILTRKLYTAFEVLPGKITLLNPQISDDLSEPDLTFIEVSESRRAVKSGWYLLNQAPNMTGLSKYRDVEYSNMLNKLICWAYFNGLLTVTTNLHIVSQTVSLNKLRQFITDLRLSFPVSLPPPTDEELIQPCEIRALAVMVNFTHDPTRKLQSVKARIQQYDLFSFGPAEESLVGSIDLVYRNLWNEIKTLHFEGSKSILSALKLLSTKIHRGSVAPELVNVFCYSRYYRSELVSLVASLVNKCINIQLGTNTEAPCNSIRIAGKNWGIFFAERGMDVQELPNDKTQKTPKNDTALLATSDKQRSRIKYPHEINAFASEGFLQFFFEDNANDTFNVYILDENNRIEVYRHCDPTKEDIINEINYIYNSGGKDRYGNHYDIVYRDFNYPQFYQLLPKQEGFRIVPFRSSL